MKKMTYSFMVHSVCAFLLLAQSAAFGTETVGLYNATPSQFYLKNRHAGGRADISFALGPRNRGWLPISGDWDIDGMDTVGLFNQSNSQFHLQNTHEGGSADASFSFGPRRSNWLPLSGDWDLSNLSDLCAEKTTCGQMSSCTEARFYLQQCGLTRLDSDRDGIPCESLCLSPPPEPPPPPPQPPYTCGEKTTCGQMASCTEARFHLEQCGLTRLDGDQDGVPCESLCR